ncbi:hypothetical protein J6TS1_10620 [Siminovitchia terrae]|uniref:Autolysin n=1 Tax=Siminovitchia terrae TaxID=1914933 RepID=A0ABQ4KT19_SIMTE|nr:N-acetylmuramoyl-L-alanine amidase [Siminovitchia terrae]GIN95192.1 hypothetical protein J6TS1_10620 [Siminovitchia terrae]
MTYKIEKIIIPGLPNIPLTVSRFVVAHESGNDKNTGPHSLDAEITFMTRNFRKAFTSHWVGGGGRIVQLAPVGKLQYGAGPKANPYSYAHVELARTKNPETFNKDYAAYIWLLRYLADQAGIPKKLDEGTATTKGIKSHDWIRRNLGGTNHTDPFRYLAQFGITKEQFKKDVENGIGAATMVTKPVDKPSISKPAPKPSQPVTKPSAYTGDSIVDYLKSIGVDSSFSNRTNLATQYEIKGYKGSAKQNLELLIKMRTGKSMTPAKPAAKKGDQKTTSIVDYLKSIGQDSSPTNRKNLAEKHGIKNYTGTLSQNTQLLKKLRG